MHLIFSGNPGTGKTTVARILAQIYRDLGLIQGGKLIEVTRSDLVVAEKGKTAVLPFSATTKSLLVTSINLPPCIKPRSR